MLELKGLSYSVAGRTILDGIDLTVPSGQSVVVLGRSGSGKSTLLMCVLGLVRPESGEVWLANAKLSAQSGRTLAETRRTRIGVVFQDGELLPELSAVENVALPALLAKRDAGEAYGRAEDLLKEFGVPLQTPTAMLSGGERQRTAVARALVNDPDLLLADEPTGALDEATRDTVAELLFAVPSARGCALVTATHDVSVAALADVRYRLTNGRLEETGT